MQCIRRCKDFLYSFDACLTKDWTINLPYLIVKVQNHGRTNQGPLITDGRNSNKMFILPTGLLQDTLGISKVMKVSLPNISDKDFRSKKLTEKVWWD